MPTPTYTPLATVTLAGTASSVTFSSIPATYRDLILVTNATAGNNAFIRYNGDSGANYTGVRIYGSGSSAASDTSDVNTINTGDLINNQVAIVQIMDYSATDKHKTSLTRITNPTAFVGANAFRWANTAAITSVGLHPAGVNTFAIGSTFNLYGVIA